jgi:hypothetical protein
LFVISGFMRTKPRAGFWAWVYGILWFLQQGWPGWASAAAGAFFFLFAGRVAEDADTNSLYLIAVAAYALCIPLWCYSLSALTGPGLSSSSVIDTGFDYTSQDLVMPHPFYAPMHWVCVVNPGERSRANLAELMQAAHTLARARYRPQGRTHSREPGD